MTHETTVKLPRCWSKLVSVVFPDDLAGITSEKFQKGNDDPEPHYDDARRVVGKFDNGAEFEVALCSGQSNYWGGFNVTTPEGMYLVGEPLEDFGDEVEVRDEQTGDVYIARIEWA
jgi:hypothetical protein